MSCSAAEPRRSPHSGPRQMTILYLRADSRSIVALFRAQDCPDRLHQRRLGAWIGGYLTQHFPFTRSTFGKRTYDRLMKRGFSFEI